MSSVFSCGFSRVAVKESFHKPGSVATESNPAQRWENYLKLLDESAHEKLAVEKTLFVKKSRIVYDLFRKMNSHNRNEYLRYFSLTSWKELSQTQKSEHTRSNCDACQVHHFAMQSLFPNATITKLKPQKLVADGLAQNENNGDTKVKPTQKAIKSAAKHIYSKINVSFQKVFKVSFAEAQTKISELELQKKKNKIQKKHERRQRARQEKQKIEVEWSKRDTDTMLATRQTYSQRARQRNTLYFETMEEAVSRAGKRKRQEELGELKKKRHSPPPNQVNFDKENLLENEGVNLQQFQQYHKSDRKPRRRLNRLVGGDVSVPVPRTNKEIKETLKDKIGAGEYVIGELVVPKKYRKLVLKSDGTLQEVEFTVSARKIPLTEIRKRELQRCEELGIVRGYMDTEYETMSDEDVMKRLKEIGECDSKVEEEFSPRQRKELLMKLQRTRHLMVWGDNSTILNHGHILYLMQSIYDPAFFYTTEEMKARGYGDVDVPAIVEKPHLYILGRCGSSEIEQLAYVNTRQECLDQLSTQIELTNGVKVKDVMRFFKGDGPEQQFESGEQKGGNAGCIACSGDSRRYRDLTYSFRRPFLSLADRERIVLAGPAGRSNRNSGVKPFKDLTVPELQRECRARGLSDEGRKKELEATLKEQLGGVQRVPAMLLNSQGRSMEDLHLGMYEVLPTEPLHDVKEHIANITTEIGAHLTDDEKKLLLDTLNLVSGTRNQLRGSDYREICIVLAKQLRGFVNEKVQLLLDTMTEIVRILYAKVQERCQQSVLRLHNQTFLHAIACEEVIGKPKILTEKKFYGRYLHSLVCHAPIQHRIICSRTTNTEQQERHFSTFSSISLATSSRRPGEIITPGMIRMQAELKQGERSTIQEQESRLGKLSKCLPKPENSIIPHRIILQYQYAYQAHLERISDFLLYGEGVWWRHVVSGIEFFDATAPCEVQPRADTLPPLHHFRSHTLKSESTYLQDNWKKCITSDEVKIPHHAIRVFDESGNLDHIIYTGFLQNDDDDDDDDGDGNECNATEGGSHEHAEDNRQMDYDEESDAEEDEEEEETIVGVVQVGEFLLDQNDQQLEEPTENEQAVASAVYIPAPTESPTVTIAHKTSYCSNDQHLSPSLLSSTLAKNVAKILGETEDVKKLDRCRNKLRNSPSSKVCEEDYKTQLAKVQSQVLGKHSELEKSFKEWEKLFTLTNDCFEPTLEDIEKDAKGSNLYKTLRLCKKFLKHWNITVHLY